MARPHLDIAAFARAMTVPPSSNLFGTARLTRFTHAHTLTEPSVGIEARDYGAHWWLNHDDRVTFAVSGYGGRRRSRHSVRLTADDSTSVDKKTRALKHSIEHGLSQTSGEGVLLTWVKRTQNRASVADISFDQVAELGTGPNLERRTSDLVAKLTERDEHSQLRQERQLTIEERLALVTLNCCWLVGGRGASHSSRYVGVGERESVMEMVGIRLISKPGSVERGKQKVP